MPFSCGGAILEAKRYECPGWLINSNNCSIRETYLALTRQLVHLPCGAIIGLPTGTRVRVAILITVGFSRFLSEQPNFK